MGQVGRNAIKHYTEKLVKKYQVDFVIANGENATHGKGLIEKHYYELLDAGVDCITLGNHYLSKDRILDYIEDADALVRPLNLLRDFGGEGSVTFEVKGQLIRVTNILGTAFMKEEVASPYLTLKGLIEKACFGYAFDGLVSAVLGTHTHVQTNDAKILPKGTGFITDVGMCGAANGVLGFEKGSVMNKTLFGDTARFELDTKDTEMINAVIMNIDDESKKCVEIFSIKLLGE